jgi:hypothetical protein
MKLTVAIVGGDIISSRIRVAVSIKDSLFGWTTTYTFGFIILIHIHYRRKMLYMHITLQIVTIKVKHF